MNARLLTDQVPNHHTAVECPAGEICAERVVDFVCDVVMCHEHSDEFTTCIDGGLHHRDCALACRDCLERARAEGWA